MTNAKARKLLRRFDAELAIYVSREKAVRRLFWQHFKEMVRADWREFRGGQNVR